MTIIATTLAGEFVSGREFRCWHSISRFSARDLLMQYHWGLGVGHLHTHQPATTSAYTDSPEESPDDIPHPTEYGSDTSDANMDIAQTQIDGPDPGSDSNSDIELDDSSSGGDEDVAEEEDFRGMWSDIYDML
jgi:hypothetical protein